MGEHRLVPQRLAQQPGGAGLDRVQPCRRLPQRGLPRRRAPAFGRPMPERAHVNGFRVDMVRPHLAARFKI